MNSTVGWQYTLHSVMFNAQAETEIAALQMMRSVYISLIQPVNSLSDLKKLMWGP